MSIARKIITGGSGPSGPSDPYWGQVVLLLNGDGQLRPGTNELTNLANPDQTSSARIYGGDVIPGGGTESRFGDGAIYFQSGDGNIVTDHSGCLKNVDFTVEFWVYFNKVSNGTYTYLWNAGRSGENKQAGYQKDDNVWMTLKGKSGQSVKNGLTSSSFQAGQWYHFAHSRQSIDFQGVSRFFVNGVAGLPDGAQDNDDYNSKYVFGNDIYRNPGIGLQGYMEGIRITHGVARYVDDFTPPTEPFPSS